MTKRYTWIVLTNPAQGREDEYNAWYTDTHLADLLRCPGIVSAQRLVATPQQRPGAAVPYRYMAQYEIETDDLDAFIRMIVERTGSADMPLSPALGPDRLGLFFEAITEKRTAPPQETQA
jgi:hypothetical protein